MLKRPKKITEETCCFKTHTASFPYLLKRSSARRTVAICINEKADLSVSAPFSAKEGDVLAFLHKKEQWILNKIEEAKKNYQRRLKREYVHGSEFFFLGQRYPLDVSRAEGKRSIIDFQAEKWNIFIRAGLTGARQKRLIKGKLIQWYQAQAKEILGGRLFHFARMLNIEPQKIAVRTQKRVWGNCDHRSKTIHLNWLIILTPMDVIDYVIVHELCHLFVPNHSQRFWKKVEQFLPDYKRRKKWLSDHTHDLILP